MTKSLQLVLHVLLGAYLLDSSRQGSKITDVTMQCENDQIDVDLEPDQSQPEANDVTGRSLAETNDVVIAAVSQNGTAARKPGEGTPKAGALSVAPEDPVRRDNAALSAAEERRRPEFENDEQYNKWEKATLAKDAQEEFVEVTKSKNPNCFAEDGETVSECEKRKCESMGTRKKDGRPCATKNCYCRCVVMTTGGRYCDEWVAEGCRDDDGCFRARDFPHLLVPMANDILDWRVRHPDVVWAAATQSHPDNVRWRREHNFQAHLLHMLRVGEIEATKRLAQQRWDMPMMHQATAIQDIAEEVSAKVDAVEKELGKPDENQTTLEAILAARRA